MRSPAKSMTARSAWRCWRSPSATACCRNGGRGDRQISEKSKARREFALRFRIRLGRDRHADAAAAAQQSPSAPPPKPEPHFIRLLAFGDYFDAAALAEFENQIGRQIAYDTYDTPAEIPAKLREGHYDLVVLPGPVLRDEIAAGAIAKIDKTRLKNAGAIAPRVVAKLAAYDPSGAYGLPYMWFATGLLLDAAKTQTRLGAGPLSFKFDLLAGSRPALRRLRRRDA